MSTKLSVQLCTEVVAMEFLNHSSQQERFYVIDIAKKKLRNAEKIYKVLDNKLAVHSQRQRSGCHEQRWLSALEKKRSFTHSGLFGMCLYTRDQ